MCTTESSGSLTKLIADARAGNKAAADHFYSCVYDELRKMARRLRRVPGSSLEPTVLVNEFIADALRKNALGDMHNRRYFFAAAIDQMRKLLIDHRRRKEAIKAGGNRQRIPLDDALNAVFSEFEQKNEFDFERFEAVLTKLRAQSPRQYAVVKYRFYGGLTQAETARMLGVSVSSVERDWRIAKAKLYAELRDIRE